MYRKALSITVLSVALLVSAIPSVVHAVGDGNFVCMWRSGYCTPTQITCRNDAVVDMDYCMSFTASTTCWHAPAKDCTPSSTDTPEEENADNTGDASVTSDTGDASVTRDPGDTGGEAATSSSITIDNPLKFNTVTGIIRAAVDFLIKAAGAILVVIILFGAFQIMTAAGNPENIKKGRNTIVWALIGFAIMLVASGLGAVIANILDVEVGPLEDGTGIATSTVDTPEGVIGVINTIARWMYGILMALGVVFVLYSAFLFLTSGGNQEKVGNARRALIYAVVALVIGVLAWGAVSLVENLLDTDTSNSGDTETVIDHNQCLQSCIDSTDPTTLPSGTNIGTYCLSVCP